MLTGGCCTINAAALIVSIRCDNMEENKNTEINTNTTASQPPVKKKWFGRGIYGSKDVPIRILDKLIFGLIAATVILTVVFTVNGGYFVNFETGGGTEIESQKLRYGQLVEKPEDPVRPGYEFNGWVYGEEEYPWSFGADKVQGEMTLIAQWKPAKVLVKFDLDGGTFGEHGPDGDFMVTDVYKRQDYSRKRTGTCQKLLENRKIPL